MLDSLRNAFTRSKAAPRTSRTRPLSTTVFMTAALLTAAGCNKGEGDTDTGTLGTSSYDTVDPHNPNQYDGDDDGWTPNEGDCNDTNDAVNPDEAETCNGIDDDCDGAVDESDASDASTWAADTDADGYGDATNTKTACAQPAGYVDLSLATDCNDADAAVSPVGTEVCDGQDNNCDGAVDEDTAADAETFYADADADGYGNAAATTKACSAPAGYVADATDCDDTIPTTYPGADEYCNGVDDDCDGVVDPNTSVDADIWYLDRDGDGSGTDATTARQCTQPEDPVAGVSYVNTDGDCDDTDSDVHPGAVELCNDEDDDCDGYADDSDTVTYYRDTDGDGYGTPSDSRSTMVCEERPEGYVTDGTDCNDTNAAINSGATELCDGQDNDCDGAVDEADAFDASRWYEDADADGYGNASALEMACYQPDGYVADASDCDDASAAVHPGATEYCDGADNDCNGVTDEATAVDALTFYRDADSDTYGNSASSEEACSAPAGYVADSSDCDDGRATVNPGGAAEVCDELDNDCDGTVDESSAIDADTWYQDADSDTFGAASSSTLACDQPAGYVADATDCLDTDGTVNPGETETCNGIDDDCDGVVDEPDAVDAVTYYEDADADGFGDEASSQIACTEPMGDWVTDDNTDCDDADANVNPEATEIVGDGTIDSDCDGDPNNSEEDYDNDGLSNGEEVDLACNPYHVDAQVVGFPSVDDMIANAYTTAGEGTDLLRGAPVESLVEESYEWSTLLGYGSSNLTDGDNDSLAYPGFYIFNYEATPSASVAPSLIWTDICGYEEAPYIDQLELAIQLADDGTWVNILTNYDPEDRVVLVALDSCLAGQPVSAFEIYGETPYDWAGACTLAAE